MLRGTYGIIYSQVAMNIPANGEPGYTASPNLTDSLTTGGFTAPFNLAGGLPAFSTALNLNSFQLDNTGNGPNYIARSFGKPGMIQTYGLEVQQQFPHALVVSLAYTGNRATRLSSANLSRPRKPR